MILAYLTTILALHPFHVSVADIKYKEEQDAIQISMRIFIDDLELAIQTFKENAQISITDKGSWKNTDEFIGEYLLEHLDIYDYREKEFQLQYLGAEIEEDVVWAYLEIEKVKKLRKITITNTVLLETYSDQENLVHFRAFEKVKSARLGVDKYSETFAWDVD
ncbi:MAG: DUF6702 family protein [Bacteroidota bacterium]